ncbi:MAG: hypothetical protein AB7G62_20310, partial [Magnetospirillum sp.]
MRALGKEYWWLFALGAFVIVAVAGLGRFLLADTLLALTQERLRGIAHTKTEQIKAQLNVIQADASIFVRRPSVADAMANPAHLNSEHHPVLNGAIADAIRYQRFNDIMVFDRDGRQTHPFPAHTPSPDTRLAVKNALESRHPQLVDLHQYEHEIVFGYVYPRVENDQVI